MTRSSRLIPIIGAVFILACSFSYGQGGVPASGEIEVYMGGKKFTSLADYEKKRDLAEAAAARLVPAVSISADDSLDPLFGKTLTIGSQGTVVSAQTTIEGGKTIEVRGAGRVAGVAPSFEQVAKDFRAGAAGSGKPPQPVASPAQFGEELHRKLGDRTNPVLVISDRQKVRVMELQGGNTL